MSGFIHHQRALPPQKSIYLPIGAPLQNYYSLIETSPFLEANCYFQGILQLLHFDHRKIYLPFVFIQNNTSENLLCNNVEGFYYFKLVNLWKFFYRKEANQNKGFIFLEDKFSNVHSIKSSIVQISQWRQSNI